MNTNSSDEVFDIEYIKNQFANQAVIGLMILSFPSVIASLSRLYSVSWHPVYLIYLTVGILPYLVYFFRKKLNYKIIIGTGIISLTAVGISSLWVYAFFGLNILYFFFAIVFSVLFFGKKPSYVLSIILTLLIFFLFILVKSGYIQYNTDFNKYNYLTSVWVTLILTFLMFSFMAIFLFGKYHATLLQAIYKISKQSVELKAALEKSEESDRLKSEFLALISHEIRTPLNAINGSAQILKYKVAENSELIPITELIIKSGNNLSMLIDDILDIAKIKAGKLELNFSPTNFRFVIEQINQLFKPKADEKKLDFTIHIDNKLPDEIIFDEVRLRQILFNLVGNAIKFTESGSVSLTVKVLPKEQIANVIDIYFEVSDTGLGIGKMEIMSIFEPFKQHTENKINFGGTGLGLNITKHLVEIMNGELLVESKLKKGSTFTVIFRNIKVSNLQINTVNTTANNPYTPVITEPENLFSSNSFTQEFITQFEQWFNTSASDRKSLNILNLKKQAAALSVISEQHQVIELITIAEKLALEIEKFSISGIKAELEKIEQVYIILKNRPQ